MTHEFFGTGAVVDQATDAVSVAAERLTESFTGPLAEILGTPTS